jgi:hypothetical protein
MCDLRGRLDCLRTKICEEKQKDVTELQADKLLGLCRELDELMTNYIRLYIKEEQY